MKERDVYILTWCELFLFSEGEIISIYDGHEKQNLSSYLVLEFFPPKCDFPLVPRPPYMMLDLSMLLDCRFNNLFYIRYVIWSTCSFKHTVTSATCVTGSKIWVLWPFSHTSSS